MTEPISNIQKKASDAKVAEIPVAQFMTKPVITLEEGTNLREAIFLFYRNQISGAPVVNKEGIIKGIISEHDLLIQAGSKDLDSPIEFSKKVISVRVDTPLKELIILLYKNKIKRIPVVGSDNHVVGIVSRIDLLSKIAASE